MAFFSEVSMHMSCQDAGTFARWYIANRVVPYHFMLHLQIALVLIDEVHLLNESRGAALEAGCISRIRMVSQLPEMKQACDSLRKNAYMAWCELTSCCKCEIELLLPD